MFSLAVWVIFFFSCKMVTSNQVSNLGLPSLVWTHCILTESRATDPRSSLSVPPLTCPWDAMKRCMNWFPLKDKKCDFVAMISCWGQENGCDGITCLCLRPAVLTWVQPTLAAENTSAVVLETPCFNKQPRFPHAQTPLLQGQQLDATP